MQERFGAVMNLYTIYMYQGFGKGQEFRAEGLVSKELTYQRKLHILWEINSPQLYLTEEKPEVRRSQDFIVFIVLITVI